jgi:hypothetical protein
VRFQRKKERKGGLERTEKKNLGTGLTHTRIRGWSCEGRVKEVVWLSAKELEDSMYNMF